MNKFSLFVRWLLQSSADPNKLALTVKGVAAMVGGWLILASPILGWNIGNAQVDAFADTAGAIIAKTAEVLGGVAALYGLGRKLWLTFRK